MLFYTNRVSASLNLNTGEVVWFDPTGIVSLLIAVITGCRLLLFPSCGETVFPIRKSHWSLRRPRTSAGLYPAWRAVSAPVPLRRKTSEGTSLYLFSPSFLQMHPTQNVNSIIFVIINDSCNSSSSFIFLHIITSMKQKYTSAAHLSANHGFLSK